jgi:branched-chain amino acid transport system substrate-binding protein
MARNANGLPPTYIQAGIYTEVAFYLRAIQAAGTDDADKVVAQMRNMKINDFMTKNGWLREDGRVMRDMYLEQVKLPAESKYPFDYVKILATIPAEEAFRPLKEGGCPLGLPVVPPPEPQQKRPEPAAASAALAESRS